MLVRSGVLVAQCAEGPAGLVRREPLLSEPQDGAPVLEDAADEADTHVAVRVQSDIYFYLEQSQEGSKKVPQNRPPKCFQIAIFLNRIQKRSHFPELIALRWTIFGVVSWTQLMRTTFGPLPELLPRVETFSSPI